MLEPVNTVVSGARNIPLEAAYLREALRLGAATLDDVISWSDTIIAESDIAEAPFTDLSFAHNRHHLQVLGALESLSPNVSTLDVLPTVLGLAYKRLVAEPTYGPDLARALWQIYVKSSFKMPEQMKDIGWFDDAYDLASGGMMGTVEGVFERLLEFTKRFEPAIDLSQLLKLDPRLREDDKL